MANTRAKGSALERLAQLYLERKGYLIHRAYQSSFSVKCTTGKCAACKFTGWKRLSRSNDIFNLFDLIAMAPGMNTLYVQVTMDTGLAPRRHKIMEFAPRLNLFDNDIEIWCWHSSKEARANRQQWTAERLDEVESGRYEWVKLGYLHMKEEATDGGQEDLFAGPGGEADEGEEGAEANAVR